MMILDLLWTTRRRRIQQGDEKTRQRQTSLSPFTSFRRHVHERCISVSRSVSLAFLRDTAWRIPWRWGWRDACAGRKQWLIRWRWWCDGDDDDDKQRVLASRRVWHIYIYIYVRTLYACSCTFCANSDDVTSGNHIARWPFVRSNFDEVTMPVLQTK